MRALALALLALLATARACPDRCECSFGELVAVDCGAVLVKARDDGYMEVDCRGNAWNCSALPPVPIGHDTLKRLEVTRCTAPSDDAGDAFQFSCAVQTAGASDAAALGMMDARAELSAENVRGLNLTKVYLSFAPGVQTTVPTAALKSLPSLRIARLLSLSSPPLYPNMFNPSPSIKFLEISMSGIKEIPADAFNGLSQLETLSLFQNDIRNIDVDGFAGLSSLTKLWLDDNPLSSLPRGVFAPTPRIQALSAERGTLRELGDGIFSGLGELREIKISNKIELKLGPYAFANLPSLTSLSLPSSRITSLPPTIFQNSTKIKDLDISDNGISVIPEDVFSNLTALQTLDLSRNRIEVVSKAMFQHLVSLVELKLDGNKIQELPDRLFSGLTKLSSVSLSHNEISVVSWAAFLGIESLSKLNLARNRIAWKCSEGGDIFEGDSSPLNNLVRLEELSLQGNAISGVFSDWRFVLLALKTLNLSYNNFTELNAADVQFLQSSIQVDFRHNHITTFDPYALYSEPSNTAEILLDDNPFDCTCALYRFLKNLRNTPNFNVKRAKCHSPPSLKNVALSEINTMDITCAVLNVSDKCECLIRPERDRIECDCSELSDLPNPKEVRVESVSLRLRSAANDLRSLPEYVRELNLSGLLLQSVPKLPETVTYLDLKNNRIKIVPRDIFNANRTLKLSNNPLECDCWSSKDVFLLKNKSRNIDDYDNVTCYPNRSLKNIDPFSLCYVYKSAVTGVLVAISGIFIGVFVALLYFYRIEIQVYLYSKRICLFLLPKERQDHDKLYDVFVSFALEDEKFVCQEILPNLEGKYLLHVQDRDWEVGDTIPTQIRQSVELSSRTLIVLSENFLKSIWAMEELRCVHTQATNDKRCRAVVVRYNFNEALDKDVKTYLSLSRSIKWSDKRFWNKLYYALPRKDMYEMGFDGNEGKVKIEGFGGEDVLAVPVWKGEYLNVVLNEDGKLVNAGLKK